MEHVNVMLWNKSTQNHLTYNNISLGNLHECSVSFRMREILTHGRVVYGVHVTQQIHSAHQILDEMVVDITAPTNTIVDDTSFVPQFKSENNIKISNTNSKALHRLVL